MFTDQVSLFADLVTSEAAIFDTVFADRPLDIFYVCITLLTAGLLAVASKHDLRTRRVPNTITAWLFRLGALSLGLHVVYAATGLTSNMLTAKWVVAVALLTVIGLVIPYLAWLFGAFGGADAKLLMALTLIYPFPIRVLMPSSVIDLTGIAILPVTDFPFNTIWASTFINSAVLSLCVPLALLAYNLTNGYLSRYAWAAHPVDTTSVTDRPGVLVLPDRETEGMTAADLDDIRRYLEWRNLSLDALRADPDAARSTLDTELSDPGDGRVVADGGTPTDDTANDPWFAESFIEDHDTYQSSATDLRCSLEALSTEDTVLVSPGVPFVLPIFAGFLVAVTAGGLIGFLPIY